MGGAPSRPSEISREVRLGVYFDRDSAGLSNLRLQLESMMAICKVFGRFLVLPPAQNIHHLVEPFHESLFWSMQHLSSHVPIVLGPEPQPPDDAYQIRDQLSSVNLFDLPMDEHWYFTKAASRIQHFETLRLPEHKRSDAARCVFESFEMIPSHHTNAISLLRKAGLEKYKYVSVHLRRGDFKTFRPKGQRSAADISRSLSPYARGKIVVIASDAAKGDVEIENEKLAPNAIKTVMLSHLHEDGVDLLAKAAAEILICRWGETFVGTQDSTFTNGIIAMRRRDSMTTRKDLDSTPLLLFDETPTYHCEGVCWNKLTDYNDMRWL